MNVLGWTLFAIGMVWSEVLGVREWRSRRQGSRTISKGWLPAALLILCGLALQGFPA